MLLYGSPEGTSGLKSLTIPVVTVRADLTGFFLQCVFFPWLWFPSVLYRTLLLQRSPLYCMVIFTGGGERALGGGHVPTVTSALPRLQYQRTPDGPSRYPIPQRKGTAASFFFHSVAE